MAAFRQFSFPILVKSVCTSNIQIRIEYYFRMEKGNSENTDKCKVCKQYIAHINFYEELKNNVQTEEVILSSAKFRIYSDHGIIENKEVPSVKLTCFMIYDKYKHLCPFDTGLLEKGVDLFFSGYVKVIDDEDPSVNNGVLIKNAGPITEWWIYGFDGGEKSLIGLCTRHALYYLMEPSDMYENIFQNIQLKNKLSKIVIEFLLDFGYQNPTFEDLIQHLKNFDLPEVEELLFREAQFLCNQIVSYDEETTDDEVPMISFACIQTLINLTGITLKEQKPYLRVEGIKKQNISLPKCVSTNLVREIFETCFEDQLTTENGTKNNGNDSETTKFKKIENSFESVDSNEEEKYQSELGNKPVKHRECSKLIIHNVKWLKKNPVKFNGFQRYSSAMVDDFTVHQGDYVMLQAEELDEPLRIAKVCYMYDSPIDGAIFHAHFFCRGFDTILGQTANPRELFVVDDCDDYPVGCVIRKAEVQFVRIPENWTELGNDVNFSLELPDNGENYFFSKIYDYEFSRFKDYVEYTASDSENPCLSCKWQKEIKANETLSYKDDSIMWKNNTYKVGSAVFLEPGQTKYVHESPEKEEEGPINDKLHPEIYRKKLDLNRGSNLDTPEPFTVGVIEDIRKQKSDIKIKVRMFYRPEDTKQSHFLAYVSDINYLFWTDDVIWTTFKYVAGKCYIAYIDDEHLARIWSGAGPFRFYYSKAYDHKNYDVYEVPLNRQILCSDLIYEGKVRLTRSNSKMNNNRKVTESAPLWRQANRPLKCLDVYAGCGGLSEGLHQSGVAKTLWAIEKDTAPAQAYQINNPCCQVFTDDCNNILEALLDGSAKNLAYPDRGEVELLVGGPPCQGFSGMNRFSSRQDSYFKNSQIVTYLSYCDYYRPKYFIFENVRNFVSFKKSLVFKLTLKCLLTMGYQISFGILQAGNFGIPQTRRRFILMGAAPGYTLPNLPDPLHVFSRSGTCLSILVDGLRYDTGSSWSESLPYRTICVRDAIGDLPDIKNGATATDIPYDEEAKSYFQKCMRNSNETVRDHICKEMSQIVEARISHIPTYPGADWRDLPNIAVQLKNGSIAKVLKYRYRKKNQNKLDPPRGVCKCALGKPCDPSDRQSNTLIPWFLVHTADRHNNWVAVYGRLEWDGFFGTTITNPEPTGTQGRVLHPEQNRVVSVRECARSQGFPDSYKFCGNILDKHRQIGNAVPPPLALALGREIMRAYNSDIDKI